MEDGGTISLREPKSNISKLGTEDGKNKNCRERPELFGERCEVCRHSMLYVVDMSIIVKSTKQTANRTAMKIDLLMQELGKILQSNRLMLNAGKTEILRTTT